jgi:hypothetical protein
LGRSGLGFVEQGQSSGEVPLAGGDEAEVVHRFCTTDFFAAAGEPFYRSAEVVLRFVEFAPVGMDEPAVLPGGARLHGHARILERPDAAVPVLQSVHHPTTSL